LYQGRRPAAVIHFILAVVIWLIGYGWIVHLYSAVDAAFQAPRGESCNT